MNALDVQTCAQCKTAPAALFVIFTTTTQRGVALPYCERCGFEVAPVLVATGYEVTLTPATTPPWLLICEYGEECPRPARRGFRMCPDHLQTLEEVYAGKESGASVALSRECPQCGLHYQAGEGPQVDQAGDVDQDQPAELFDVPTPAESTRGGYDR